MFKKFLLTALIISPNIAFTVDTAPEIKESMSVLASNTAEYTKAIQTLLESVSAFSEEKKKEFMALYAKIIKINSVIVMKSSDMKDEIDEVVALQFSPYLEKSVKQLEKELANAKEELIAFDESIKQAIENFFELMEKASESVRVFETKIKDVASEDRKNLRNELNQLLVSEIFTDTNPKLVSELFTDTDPELKKQMTFYAKKTIQMNAIVIDLMTAMPDDKKQEFRKLLTDCSFLYAALGIKKGGKVEELPEEVRNQLSLHLSKDVKTIEQEITDIKEKMIILVHTLQDKVESYFAAIDESIEASSDFYQVTKDLSDKEKKDLGIEMQKLIMNELGTN